MIVAVDIGLANECNLACPHCYRPALIRQCLLMWASMGCRRCSSVGEARKLTS
jgi:MoaA/NifB/PqqE/SkfB family radical SAM enzyme